MPASTITIVIELVGLTAGFFSVCGSLWCLLDPCWKITSQDLSVQPYDVCYGIWIGCTIPSDGSWICDGYYGKTVIDLNISARQHFCRAATISCIILTSCSLLLGSIGSHCCVLKSIDNGHKRLYRCLTGWFFLIAGCLVASAGSWYLVEIYYERVWYYRVGPNGLGYTIGRAIFVALASGALDLIAGACFTLCSRNGCCGGHTSQDTDYRHENYHTTNGKTLPLQKRQNNRKEYKPNEVMTEYI
ncbi:claudin-1-like [Ciona intestinalis]